MIPRIGQGFDVHPFSPDRRRRLVLAGITVPGPGLAGHSDADVVAHAAADALLGAAGLADIGSHFPDTDPAYAEADSMDLLARVVLTVSSEYRIGNIDTTLILEAPKIAPYREAMQQRMQEVVGAPVSVKAKRAESLGSLGRGEGVACLAVAVLVAR